MMEDTINIQYASECTDLPDEHQLRLWVNTASVALAKDAEITLRIVDEQEGAQLNERWRKIQGATNVLSFPYDILTGAKADLYGDIVICAPLVACESKARHINPDSHWAHLVIHGVLHLGGFDHIDPQDAERMENLEIKLLGKLNYQNPYLCHPEFSSRDHHSKTV